MAASSGHARPTPGGDARTIAARKVRIKRIYSFEFIRFYSTIMTLKQLEAFYWAATCKNFSVAAGRLNISVSSLSRRIGELEAAIGADLFNRDNRSAVLTPLGDRLLAHARDVLRSAEHFMRRASDAR